MSRTLKISLCISLGLLVLAVASVFGLYYGVHAYYEPGLPSVDELRELELEVPLRIYTRDGKLIGEYGAERRQPLTYDQLPQKIIDAFLAAEDDRFFEHPGVDWQGLMRATWKLVLTGEKSQGGSTITMQLARNVFLSSTRSYERKIREILLALRIEHEMSKEEILEVYLNKIFLGQRAYGVGAASRVYFGVEPKALDWSQAAMLAGLPKAPSRVNPVSSPERALDRRNYVLRRLRDLHKISELDYQAALAQVPEVELTPFQLETDAPFVAEMIRAEMVQKYGEKAYTTGYEVHATVSSQRQDAANRALRGGLLAYEERHGWRGPEARLPKELLSELSSPADAIETFLRERPRAQGLHAAAVVSVTANKITALVTGRRLVEIDKPGFTWARISSTKPLAPGDIVRVRALEDKWRLAQIPQVQGALTAINPQTGALEAVIGGYDFFLNKYNRATQALRQPGSGFKPFLYAAAFEKGLTPATVLLDEPIVYHDSELEGAWRPQNYDGKFKGSMRLREALVQSRNLVTIRLLQEVGLGFARDYISRFGLNKDRIPRDLSMALGTGSFTPMEMAEAYSVLANGGFRVKPYMIQSIHDGLGNKIFEATAPILCDPCDPGLMASSGDGVQVDGPITTKAEELPRSLDARVIWLVDDILREVTIRGTAARARRLGRQDIAGKTGTTNDETDAWFYGFNNDLVSVVWIGFDQPAPLGRGEVGGRAALPIWMDFMRESLHEVPETPRERPEGLVNVRIDRDSGLLAVGGDPDAVTEIVQQEHVPQMDDGAWGKNVVPVDELF